MSIPFAQLLVAETLSLDNKPQFSIPKLRTHLLSMLLLWGGLLGGAGFAFLTQLLLAHTVTVAEMGMIAGVMSLMLLAMPIAEFGISGLWLRMFGRDGVAAFSWVRPSLFIVFTTSAIALVGLLLIGQWAWDAPQQHQLLYWLLPLPPIEAVVVLVGTRMQLEGRYRVLALWRALPKFSRFLIVLAAWWVGLDILTIAIGYFLSSLVVFGIAIRRLLPMLLGEVNIEKIEAAHYKPTIAEKNYRRQHSLAIKDVIKAAWPFAMGSVFSLIYLQSDIFILSALSDVESTGLYSVAFSLIALVYLLPTAVFNQFLLPRYHRWAEHDRHSLLKAYRLGNGYMVVIGLLVMLMLAWLAPYLVLWFFGVKYADAGEIVQVLAICIPFRYLASSIGNCLVTQDHMQRKMKYQMTVAIFNVGLNILMIPTYGMFGAAVATVASEMLLCALYLMGVWKHIFGINALRGWTLNYKVIVQ